MSIESLGLVKTSFIDYPGVISAVLFTHGCNLRCPYCHNPECVLGSPPGDFLLLEEVRTFIEKRKSILGGVCITGGEPFLHKDLPHLVAMLRSQGLKVKTDTNGTFPERLAAVGADFIDMDIKTRPVHYHRLMGHTTAPFSPEAERVAEAVQSSIERLKKSDIPHRFRITAVPGIVDEEDIIALADIIGTGETCLLSGFNPGITLDPTWEKVSPYPDTTLDTFAAVLRSGGISVEIRYNHSAA